MSNVNHEIFVNFFHEIQNLINTLSASSNSLSKCNPESEKIDKAGIIHHANLICEVVENMKLHVTLVNIDTNPSFFSLQKPKVMNVYDVFVRTIHIFKPRAKKNKVKFKIEADQIPSIEILPILNIVPSIVFDNCIKYCPSDSIVYVDIELIDKDISVTIQSMGPMVKDEDVIKLTQKGYRGENAQEVTSEGSGVGLYYLKIICDLCNINLSISSNQNSYIIDNMGYSNFKVNMIIPGIINN